MKLRRFVPKNKFSLLLGGIALVVLPLLWPAFADGQEADTSEENKRIAPAVATLRPVVPNGYFLFPIAPGKPNFLSGSMGELRPNHFHGGLDIGARSGRTLPAKATCTLDASHAMSDNASACFQVSLGHKPRSG